MASFLLYKLKVDSNSNNMSHRAAVPKTRSGDSNYLSIKDSESLDTCIQNTLSALYPPFDATAATVLWQLFSVVEKLYRGDGLRCLIDFLVPAKRILQCIQQETCAKYTGLIFYHEGWPLCIHEKVLVQLASLHRVRLKPGDFYIQVIPLGKQSAKLVLKCLSRNGQGIEEIVVPDIMYGSIFTAEFLENVNCERNGSPLHSCLLTTGTTVYRTPWKNIVNPIFVPTSETILQSFSSSSLADQLISNNPDKSSMTRTMESNSSQEGSTSDDTASTVVDATLTDNHGKQENSSSNVDSPSESRDKQEPANAPPGDNEGDSVHLAVFPPKSTSTEGAPPELGNASEAKPETPKEKGDSPKLEVKTSAKTLSFSTDLSSPSPRRRQVRDSVSFETKRLFRKSYIEALQNPMHLGSSSDESITEEAEEIETGSFGMSDVLRNSNNLACSKQNQRRRESLPIRLSPRIERAEVTCANSSQSSNSLLVLQASPSATSSRAGPRRSKSLDRSHKGLQLKGHRERVSSGDSSIRNPKKLLNGHAFRIGRSDHEGHSFHVGKSQKCTKVDTGKEPI
nr:PREDICTED: rho guanine nucleotide exchange factor 40-like [Latimeria chalumnae]|eukprot:XP_014350429.1 PREDICTED: rho guanine nucleotide exchange factor 40-like [Latimeria chalumnae]